MLKEKMLAGVEGNETVRQFRACFDIIDWNLLRTEAVGWVLPTTMSLS